jgi:hypothetical protein
MPRNSGRRSRILRAEISLDGKLVSPVMRAGIHEFAALEDADELHLAIQPVILGGVKNPTLTGLPEGFLPQDHNFKLLSAATVSGKLLLRYKRIARGKKRVT